MCPAGLHHKAVLIMPVYFTLDLLFNGTHFKRRKVFAIGQRLQAVPVSANAREFLDVAVPRRNVLIADRPVDSIPETLGSRKFEIAPALAGPPPHDRLTANLVAADPVERLFLYVGMLLVFYKKVLCVLAEGITLTDDGVFVDHGFWLLHAMRKVPRVFSGGGIVF